MGELIDIRGTRIYVEDYGSSNEEVLLYLHGGPGASCIDFCYHQAKALSPNIRVIAIDQRGVLRSDPINEDGLFGINDIIEDCEELKKHLKIKNWSILGHSFGGYVALMYAQLYPDSVKKIIYEAPCFDAMLSMQSLLKIALQIFEKENQTDNLEECYKYMNGTYSTNELWNAWGHIGHLLGNQRDYIYFHRIEPNDYNKIIDESNATEELWLRTQRHSQKLQDEGKFFNSLLPVLRLVKQPSLLLHGRHDPVCSPEQRIAFQEQTEHGRTVVFEESAHFPRIEEAEKYTNTVIEFIFEGSFEEGRGIR